MYIRNQSNSGGGTDADTYSLTFIYVNEWYDILCRSDIWTRQEHTDSYTHQHIYNNNKAKQQQRKKKSFGYIRNEYMYRKVLWLSESARHRP